MNIYLCSSKLSVNFLTRLRCITPKMLDNDDDDDDDDDDDGDNDNNEYEGSDRGWTQPKSNQFFLGILMHNTKPPLLLPSELHP